METRIFCCQTHFDRVSALSRQDVDAICAQLTTSSSDEVRVEWGDDGGSYVNVLVKSREPLTSWARIQRVYVNDDSLLSNATIITVTGRNQWSDYRLLHHYDPEQELDCMGE